MRKLFLASFTFKTGDQEFNENRLVVVTKQDVDRWLSREGNGGETPGPDLHRTIALEKLLDWFPKTFTESELGFANAYAAIE